jgi:hypothetical protein
MAKDMESRYLHEGFSKLPDEVLLNIFTHSHNDTMPYFRTAYLLRIAGVCRRFRDIVFSYAPFWDCISTSFRPEAVDMALLRSKQIPLTALVSGFKKTPGESTTFLKKIQAHAHRITALFVDFPADDYDDPGLVWRAIKDSLRLLNESRFHALEDFSFGAPRPYVELNDYQTFGSDDSDIMSGNEEDEGIVLPALSTSIDDDLYHVYLHWRPSSLKHLSLYELVPRVHPELVLTSLHLQYISEWHLPERPLTQLMTFIKTQSRLQQFTLVIGCPEEQDFAWKEIIHMPELHTLGLKTPDLVFHYTSSICPIPQIFQHLLIPSVEVIDLKFPVQTDGFSLGTIFVQDYPRLTEFAVMLTHKEGLEMEFAPFRFFFFAIPAFDVPGTQAWQCNHSKRRS